jgi:ubiquinone/menaquinone biosynthesis C-methylase UbiE
MKTRTELLKSLDKGLVIAELGVFKGEFSQDIYNICEPKELHLVDLFDGIVRSGDVNGNNIEIFHGAKLLRIVEGKFVNTKNVFIKRRDSVEFLKSFPDGYFDFIYIDSSHQYEHTKKELAESLRVIKKGGIIAGHDYNREQFFEVCDAVDEFCLEHDFHLQTTTDDGLNSFFIKI